MGLQTLVDRGVTSEHVAAEARYWGLRAGVLMLVGDSFSAVSFAERAAHEGRLALALQEHEAAGKCSHCGEPIESGAWPTDAGRDGPFCSYDCSLAADGRL